MEYTLGISIGARATSAAIVRVTPSNTDSPRADAPTQLALGALHRSIPTLVAIDGNGSLVVGSAAERSDVAETAVDGFFDHVGSTHAVMVGERAYSAESLFAAVVAWVVELVAEREGQPAAGIAVTCPDEWHDTQRQLLRSALAVAGVTGYRLISETQAVAARRPTETSVSQSSSTESEQVEACLGAAVFAAMSAYPAVVFTSDSPRVTGFDAVLASGNPVPFTHQREKTGRRTVLARVAIGIGTAAAAGLVAVALNATAPQAFGGTVPGGDTGWVIVSEGGKHTERGSATTPTPKPSQSPSATPKPSKPADAPSGETESNNRGGSSGSGGGSSSGWNPRPGTGGGGSSGGGYVPAPPAPPVPPVTVPTQPTDPGTPPPSETPSPEPTDPGATEPPAPIEPEQPVEPPADGGAVGEE